MKNGLLDIGFMSTVMTVDYSMLFPFVMVEEIHGPLCFVSSFELVLVGKDMFT